MGRAEYELEYYESAVAQFSRARELAPDRPSILLGQGRAYLALGDYTSSLESAEQALELAPEGGPEQGQALELLHDLGGMDPDAAPLLVLSDWYAGRGDDAALQQVNGQIPERISYRMKVDLGGQIRFLGSNFHEPSDGRVQVDLYFRPIAPMDTDYTVFMHNYVHEEDISLLPPDRQQHGYIRGRETYPTSRWVEGAVYRARTVRELAPAEYRFVFGV